MKLNTLFLLLTVLPIKWETDFNNAKKKAKENHELILLNFSGSDWCGPCIVLRRDYLESQVFAEMANENLKKQSVQNLVRVTRKAEMVTTITIMETIMGKAKEMENIKNKEAICSLFF